MPTVKACLSVPYREEAERLAAILDRAFEAEGAPVAHHEDEAAGLWRVEVYREGDDPDALADAVRDALGSDGFAAPVTVETLDEIDWVKASLEGLPAIRGGRFVVHGIHARGAVRPTDIGLRVEASRAFGTGHHGTTLGCLELIDWLIGRHAVTSALDLGTGTGVLAMALAKAARVPVLATDIDPVAVTITAENARLNGVHTLVTAALADGLQGAPQARAPYDLIVANILAGPLIAMAGAMAALRAPGGVIILSGLMRRQERAVLARYRAAGLVPLRAVRHGEWSALLLGEPQ